MKKEKEIIRTIFWQDWGVFIPSTMVSRGYETPADLLEGMKRTKLNKTAPEWYRAVKAKYEFDDGGLDKSNHFSKWTIEERGKDVIYSILFLKTWNNTAYDKHILMHELIHACSFQLKDFLDPIKENEAFAYTHGYLFEHIVEKLNNPPK